jgi:hypothetical protein
MMETVEQVGLSLKGSSFHLPPPTTALDYLEMMTLLQQGILSSSFNPSPSKLPSLAVLSTFAHSRVHLVSLNLDSYNIKCRVPRSQKASVYQAKSC